MTRQEISRAIAELAQRVTPHHPVCAGMLFVIAAAMAEEDDTYLRKIVQAVRPIAEDRTRHYLREQEKRSRLN
jgi:hypothetical protein